MYIPLEMLEIEKPHKQFGFLTHLCLILRQTVSYALCGVWVLAAQLLVGPLFHKEIISSLTLWLLN